MFCLSYISLNFFYKFCTRHVKFYLVKTKNKITGRKSFASASGTLSFTINFMIVILMLYYCLCLDGAAIIVLNLSGFIYLNSHDSLEYLVMLLILTLETKFEQRNSNKAIGITNSVKFFFFQKSIQLRSGSKI